MSKKITIEDNHLVEFVGGPLDGQIRVMQVYVALIPVHGIAGYPMFDEHGNPYAYYQNVNAAVVSRELNNECFTRYKFYIDGKEQLSNLGRK